MKFLIGMEPQEVVDIYENNALLFSEDVRDAMRRFDALDADIATLEWLWDWIICDEDAIDEASEENRHRLFKLFVRILADIERILDVQSTESTVESEESEGGTALPKGRAAGSQE